jgi:hypothetical protein
MDSAAYKKIVGVQGNRISWVGHDAEECRVIILLENNQAISVPDDDFVLVDNASGVLSELLEEEELHSSQIVALKTYYHSQAFSKGFGDGYNRNPYADGAFVRPEWKAEYASAYEAGKKSREEQDKSSAVPIVSDGGVNVTVTSGQDSVVVVSEGAPAEGADSIPS